MNRLGFTQKDFDKIYTKLIKTNKTINVITHLSESDAENQSFTKKQLNIFNEIIKHKNVYNTSTLNSAAALINCYDTKTNTIRIGLALYGITNVPYKHTNCNLQPVMSLYTKVVAFQYIKKGDYVGYNRKYQAQYDTTIAIICIGYGDGYPQNTPSGTPVLINNKIYRTAGQVSMDLTAIDIKDSKEVKIGSVVTLFDSKKLSINHVAKKMKTTSYAILAGINKERIYRIY